MQMQTTFFNRTRAFLREVKRGFAHTVLLPFKKCLANLAKSKCKIHLIVQESDGIDFNQTVYTVNVQIHNLKSIGLAAKEQAIEDIFEHVHNTAINDELHKWFVFGLIGNGRHISDLTPEQLNKLACELPGLILAIYNYRLAQRKEAGNGV
ncbi:hypothetical protein Mucpa_2446 [Mucilaginibacter paludis DSM 18603]|uniref:Uncharacterized protein n=2 Tax=Mucilaginibacter TaxID=423349 RepID=H1YIK2_9SPHI|nr:hypothetical protein Mucpa_2446 [Mucilaginibacter paludis DSM 18603]